MNKTLAFLILFMLLCMSFVFAALADDTISYYALENLTDSSGNGYTLTNNGATSGATGILDDAYSFDGTNDYMSSAPSFSSNTISISFWAKSDTTNADKVIVMISDGSSNNMFGVYVLSDGTLQVYDRRDGSTYSDGGSSYDTGWHHYVITHTGSTGTLYKDGSSVLVAASDSNSVDWSTLHIGKKTDVSSYYFDGVIDEVAVFDVALTADNVTYLYNSGSPGVAQQYPFYSFFDISAVDAWNGSAINTFSAYLNSSWYHTTNGTINTGINSSLGLEFDIDLNATGYADRTYTDYNTSVNLAAELYPKNSILINIYSEETGLTITDNISITVSGNASEEVYYTINGTYFLENLTAGTYTIKFNGDNYTLTSYSVTVADGSTQILNAYLSASTDTVIMSYIDEDSGKTLEGVSASMSRLINGSWTVIQSKSSDITGRVQFTYTKEINYRFTASITDYTTKTFYLDPVIFDSYNVKMSKVTTIVDAPDYQGVAITVTPSVYYNEQINNFSITFESHDGLLSSYSYNVSFPTGSYAGSGVNAYGGTFSHSLNITGAAWLDKVFITYAFDTSIGSEKNYSRAYEIRDPSVDAGVLIDNEDNTFGLGIFERILISLIVVILITGVLSLVGGIMIGAPIGLLLMGYLTLIGFMPLWAALPSLFVGFILIVARSS